MKGKILLVDHVTLPPPPSPFGPCSTQQTPDQHLSLPVQYPALRSGPSTDPASGTHPPACPGSRHCRRLKAGDSPPLSARTRGPGASQKIATTRCHPTIVQIRSLRRLPPSTLRSSALCFPLRGVLPPSHAHARASGVAAGEGGNTKAQKGHTPSPRVAQTLAVTYHSGT